jgi:hypothetical protein
VAVWAEYAKYVARRWWFVAVGVIGGVLTIVTLVASIVVPTWLGVVILVGGLTIAQFLAFKDMRDERDMARAELQAAEVGIGLKVWLGQQIEELRGLLTTLRAVLDGNPFDPERARPIDEYFWQIRDEVDRKLHTSAPAWVDYFNEGSISTAVGLFYPQADLIRSQFVPMIESTIDRIAHIQGQL